MKTRKPHCLRSIPMAHPLKGAITSTPRAEKLANTRHWQPIRTVARFKSLYVKAIGGDHGDKKG
jgi:hypothetical protein